MAAGAVRSRRMRGAGVAIVGLLGSAAVAEAITPGEPFTVSPGQGAPFTVVEVSGANCSEAPAPTVVGTVVGSPDVGVVAQFTATPDADGDWTTTFTVPPNKPAGPYQVTAQCKADPNQSTGDDYANQPFTILQGEAATMTVSPLAGQAGQDVMLTVSGTLCRGEAAAVDVGIFLRTPEDVGEADEFVARGTATPNGQGAWTIQLTIPGSSAPGTYGVGAQCLVAGTQFFLYAPVDVMLSPPEAPPAVPVVRQPAFTG